MLSRVNTEHIVEKMVALCQELDLLKCTNVRLASLQTYNIILEAIEGKLVVADLAENLVSLWFPSIARQKKRIWDSQWIDVNLKVSGIILESGCFDDDIWSESDPED